MVRVLLAESQRNSIQRPAPLATWHRREPLHARVEKGRLVFNEPTTPPEGTVLELVADNEGGDLSESERRALHDALSKSWGGTQNRPAAPDLFLQEFAECFTTLGHAPHIGRSYRQSPVSGMRRFLLKRTRYYVYYVAGEEDVRVLAVCHAQRKVGPPLRA